MDESQQLQLRLRRIARQRLESLERAGVQHLCRPSAPTASIDHQVFETRAPVSAVAAVSVPPNLERKPDLITDSNADLQQLPVLTLAQRETRLRKMGQTVAACKLCPELVANRSQTVFGVGNPEARLCLFGEAPGADEDKQGEPFVGRAGQLLTKIIEACNMTRDDVYILNVLKCRPPSNRNPSPAEAQNCRPFFEQQLEIIRPEFICCLGSIAATTLLETKLSIGKLRGRLHEWRWAKVLATYHPAYLLRNPGAKRDVWNDMQILMREMGIQTKTDA